MTKATNNSVSEEVARGLKNTRLRLKKKIATFRKELEDDPSLVHDDAFCAEHATEIDALQREEAKYSQIMELYSGQATPVTPEAQLTGGTTMAGKSVANDLKSALAAAARRGIAVGMVKTIAQEAMEALGENCPPLIAALPPDLRDAALCALVYMATQAAPGVPLASEAQDVSLLALEGLSATVFADAATKIAPKLIPLFKSVAALKAVEGLAAIGTGTGTGEA